MGLRGVNCSGWLNGGVSPAGNLRDNPSWTHISMKDVQPQLQPSTEEATQPLRAKFNWWRWFWIATLLVSLAYAWYCFYVPSNSIAWADNYSSAQQRAGESDKPVIIYFTGKWCVPCRIMKRNVWADKEVTSLVNTGFIPVMIDVDDPDSASTL